MNIERLIDKAKGLGLTYLRVADDDDEIAIELPGTPSAALQIERTAVAEPVDRDVTSQFVGYFRPVAQAGTEVTKGEVIAVIESLGLPNDILAPSAGTLSEFAVADGDAVEYGTVLARIKV